MSLVDSRLVTKQHVEEGANFTIDSDTLATFPVGDSREGESIVVGVDPQNLASEWSIKGRFLSENSDFEAVIGDSISQSMYSPHPSKYVVLANPLVEDIKFQNLTFSIVGVCVDPLNNGFVTYVPLDILENATRIFSPNLLLVKLNNSANRETVISEVRSMVQAVNPDLDVFDLSRVVQKNTSFLASTWQTIMILPLFTLASAAICLAGYMMLAVDEQHQEFGILRAVGAKPRVIIIYLLDSKRNCAPFKFCSGNFAWRYRNFAYFDDKPDCYKPYYSGNSHVGLAIALIAMFIFSLYPAFKLAKTSILKIWLNVLNVLGKNFKSSVYAGSWYMKSWS